MYFPITETHEKCRDKLIYVMYLHTLTDKITTETHSEYNLIKYLVQSWAFDI